MRRRSLKDCQSPSGAPASPAISCAGCRRWNDRSKPDVVQFAELISADYSPERSVPSLQTLQRLACLDLVVRQDKMTADAAFTGSLSASGTAPSPVGSFEAATTTGHRRVQGPRRRQDDARRTSISASAGCRQKRHEADELGCRCRLVVVTVAGSSSSSPSSSFLKTTALHSTDLCPSTR